MTLKMPSIALAKREQQAREEMRVGHGSTDPLRLEKRRYQATKNIEILKGFVQRLRDEYKALVATDQQISAAFQKQYPDPAKVPPEVTQQFFEGHQARQWQKMQLEIMAMQFNASADQIDAQCMIFDALTVRMVKKNKAGKTGHYRQTTAFTLFDLVGNMQALMTAYDPVKFPEAAETDAPTWEPEIDDEDIFLDDEPETEKKDKR